MNEQTRSRPLTGRLLAAAGPTRTPENNRWLAILLAGIAGALNSVGFVAVATYTSHMTGLVASVADHVAVADHAVLGSLVTARIAVCAIASFLAGAACCAVIFNWGRRRDLRSRYANVLLLQAVLVLCFGALADRWHWEHRAWVFVAVLCFTMGLQNAIITKISAAQIRTTHVTGMVTDIGIELGKLAYPNRNRHQDPVRADRGKLVLLTSLVGAFFIGSMAGAAGYVSFGFAVLLVPALLLLVVAAPNVVADLFSDAAARRRGTAP